MEAYKEAKQSAQTEQTPMEWVNKRLFAISHAGVSEALSAQCAYHLAEWCAEAQRQVVKERGRADLEADNARQSIIEINELRAELVKVKQAMTEGSAVECVQNNARRFRNEDGEHIEAIHVGAALELAQRCDEAERRLEREVCRLAACGVVYNTLPYPTEPTMACPDCDGTGKEKQQTAYSPFDDPPEYHDSIAGDGHKTSGDQQAAREWVKENLVEVMDEGEFVFSALAEKDANELADMHDAQKDRADRRRGKDEGICENVRR
jgi:hypothetical protein